jgi:monofunctional glycosyltransferase
VIRRLAKWLALACAGVITLSVFAVAVLRWANPPTTAFMIRASLARPAEDIRYRWVDLEQISPHAAVAVIAAEDQLFPFHSGFDLDSIRDAVGSGSQRKRVRGASTISQQLAKNLFLSSERSLVRKGLEAYFTVLIELLWAKERILEVYLNVAQFGRGVYGVEAAARRFFGKPAMQLDPSESALLAAVLPNPLRFKADRPSLYVTTRRDWIIDQMRGLGGPAYLSYLTSDGKRKLPGWLADPP